MKRIIFLAVMICTLNIVQAIELFDVGKSHWGMTSDEVIKSDGRVLWINHRAVGIPSGYLILSASIEFKKGFYSLLSYVLKDNHLVSVSYWFYPTKMIGKDYTKEMYVDDFNKIQEDLEEQYGKPDKMINDYQCIWNTEKTVILHLIKEQYGSASHGIIYYDINVWKQMGETSVQLNPI